MATSAVGKNDRTIGTRGDAQEQEQGDQYRWIILLGLITAAIMEVLDTTIINVALPQMAGNLGATIQEIAWVSTGYILSNVVVLPMTAFFTATFGRKNYLTGSIILFVTASFLCGTSHSLGELVSVARRAGRGRRGAPLDRAGDAAPDLPARRAGDGAGHLHPRHHRRADARADARRMDHRQLQLGLVLLHQRADRNRGDVPGDGFSPRSAGHAQETAVDRLGGHFAADDRPRGRSSTCSRKGGRRTGSTTR